MYKKENKENNATIKFGVTLEQKADIESCANAMGFSTSEYIRMKVLDSTQGKDEIMRLIIRVLPQMCEAAKKLDDPNLTKEMNELWQSLK